MYSASSGTYRQLEIATWRFREHRAALHGKKAVLARRDYKRARARWAADLELEGPPSPSTHLDTLADLRAAKSTEKWHTDRAKGQRWRFRRLESCCARTRHTRCDLCGTHGKPVPEGCAIARLCGRCGLLNAKRRRARFGRARARAIIEGARYGYTRKNRAGGAYTEKMLTLTVPHWFRSNVVDHVNELARSTSTRERRYAEAGRELLDKANDTVKLRVEALWRAWPRFLRKFNRWLKLMGIDGVRMHRAAEWTPGSDAQGHPHFHLWLWSPFIPAELISVLWTESLLEIGLPEPRSGIRPERYAKSFPHVRQLAVVDLKQVKSFNGNMARELMKGGERDALTLSRIAFVERFGAGKKNEPIDDDEDPRAAVRKRFGTAGEDVFEYAEGWTISEVIDTALPRVLASLYEALEGKRLSQASAGFFVEDDKPRCPCCWGEGHFRIIFEPSVPMKPTEQPIETMRGPP